jgi:phage portal protein BeeE
MLLHKFQYLPGDYGVGANVPAVHFPVAQLFHLCILRRRLDWTAFDWRFTDASMRAHTYVPPADIVLSNLSVAVRCVALRSELLASVPLHLFRRDANGGRERADDLPLYGVLHDNANPNQSAFEFREFMVRSLDLHGNAFARIERNARGQVVALWPFLYGDVEVEQLPTKRLRYRIFNGRRSEILLAEEVLHVRGASRDNIIGQSPITIARGALGLALSQNETAALSKLRRAFDTRFETGGAGHSRSQLNDADQRPSHRGAASLTANRRRTV